MFGFKKKNTHHFDGEKQTKETQNQEDAKTEWVWVVGYKGTENDMTCQGFQYELGKTYSMPENEVQMCHSGYHLCLSLSDVFGYYSVDYGNRFFKVKACVSKYDLDRYGEHYSWNCSVDKLVAKEIQFIEEVSVDEVWDTYMEKNNITQEMQDVLLKYKPQLQELGYDKIVDLYHVDILVEDGYSRPFAWYVVDDDKFDVAHAVASQKELNMDVRALFIMRY